MRLSLRELSFRLSLDLLAASIHWSMDWHSLSQPEIRARGRLAGKALPVGGTLLQLAHAIVKADSLRRLPQRIVIRRALGFLTCWGPALSVAQGNLRVDAGNYVDFVGTAFTGRIAQGLALLYCERLGYVFQCHWSILL
jgi:hypothetical protein